MLVFCCVCVFLINGKYIYDSQQFHHISHECVKLIFLLPVLNCVIKNIDVSLTFYHLQTHMFSHSVVKEKGECFESMNPTESSVLWRTRALFEVLHPHRLTSAWVRECHVEFMTVVIVPT